MKELVPVVRKADMKAAAGAAGGQEAREAGEAPPGTRLAVAAAHTSESHTCGSHTCGSHTCRRWL